MTRELVVTAVSGIGEVDDGSDLASLVAGAAVLADGDIIVVTSKVVSKAEGRVRAMPREEAVAAETDRVVARRGPTQIVRTPHGLVMAAAGVDASNTPPGTVVLLPQDPDRSAAGLRDRFHELTGCNVAVVVSDTSGRAWRTGQTDVAIGCAGLVVLDDHAGRRDDYGNELAVTAPAVADEVAAAADLVTRKLARAPVAVVGGLADWVLPVGEHGPGASALVRPESEDMFGYGAREAVLEALAPASDGRGFGVPAEPSDVQEALRLIFEAVAPVSGHGSEVVVGLGSLDAETRGWVRAVSSAVARAHGWAAATENAERVSFRPVLP